MLTIRRAGVSRVHYAICAAILLLVGISSVLYGSVRASGDVWSEAYDVTVSTTARSHAGVASWHSHVKDCSVRRITLEIAAEVREIDACVSEKLGVGVAVMKYVFPHDDDRDLRYALKLPHDSRYHLILSIVYDANFELLDTGTLTMYMGFGARLVQVDDPSIIFDPIIIANGPTTAVKVYSMNDNFQPLFSDDEKFVPSDLFGISNNGAYAVLHVYGNSIGIADTQIKKVRYITRENFDHVRNIGLRLAVSNDGRTIATVAADGTFAKIYTVRDGCGRADQGMPKSHEKCYEIDFSNALMQSPVLSGQTIYDVEFSDDNESVVIRSYAESESGTVYESVIRPDPNTKRLNYLALGDSYSSGEGDVTNKGAYYHPGTKENGQCHLSSRSYPFVLRDWWKINTSTMSSVACSGAHVLRDYVQQPASYRGQDGRLGNISLEKVAQQKSAALNDKKPGIAPQIEFVKKYRPKVVTLTGGGNDVGFADVLKYCASNASIGFVPIADTCTYATVGTFTNRMLLQSIDNQYRTMTQLIREIQTASPYTKIYIIGYPQFVSTDALCSLNVALLNVKERQMVRTMTTRLNAVLSRAAADTGVAFIDIENALEGGQLCQGSEYVSGLHNVMTESVRSEMFHPNAVGHTKMANEIFRQAPSVESYIPTPAIQEAESMEVYMTVPIVKKTYAMKTVVDPNTYQTMQMIDVTLQPGSPVVVNMFSEPTHLGTFTADTSGNFTAEVLLPKSVTPGHHTLVIEGTSDLGEPITLYQFVTVTSGIQGDMDGDGIPDEQDRCDFISERIDEVTGIDMCSDTDIAGMVDSKEFTKGDELRVLGDYSTPQYYGESLSLRTGESETRVGATNISDSDKPGELKVNTTNTTQDNLILWAVGIVGAVMLAVCTVRIIARRKHE